MNTPDFTWLFVKMLSGLVLVLALAVVVFRFVLPRAGFRGRLKGDWATILDIARLGPHQNLYLVKIAQRYFVLGSGEKGVTPITELTAEEGQKIAKGES